MGTGQLLDHFHRNVARFRLAHNLLKRLGNGQLTFCRPLRRGKLQQNHEASALAVL